MNKRMISVGFIVTGLLSSWLAWDRPDIQHFVKEAVARKQMNEEIDELLKTTDALLEQSTHRSAPPSLRSQQDAQANDISARADGAIEVLQTINQKLEHHEEEYAAFETDDEAVAELRKEYEAAVKAKAPIPEEQLATLIAGRKARYDHHIAEGVA
jgi:phosphoglycolate phosphatase-like HAD superfamily hydrolase